MIIEFSKDIELTDWYSLPWIYNTFFRKDSRCNNGTRALVKICKTYYPEIWMTYFYNELAFMNFILDGGKYCPNVKFDENAVIVKQKVDDFIVKISKLRAFT